VSGTDEQEPGVARAFDLAGITNTVGAPFLRVLGFQPRETRGQTEWPSIVGRVEIGERPVCPRFSSFMPS